MPDLARLPSISLVTPSYNQGQYLERTIRSILGQGYPGLEYVVMDGGSDDGSREIIAQYADHLTHWESGKDGGQADAINRGFSHTHGEIMGWLNSDDMLVDGALLLVGRIFAALPEIDWISGRVLTMTPAGHLADMGLQNAYSRRLIARGWYHGRGLGFIMQESTFWRRSLWERAGARLNDLHFGMDYDLWRRFGQFADLVPIQAPLAAFRHNPMAKSRAIEAYYREIGVVLPGWAALPGKLIRLALQLPIRLKLTRQIRYEREMNRWVYDPGFARRVGGRDKRVILQEG